MFILEMSNILAFALKYTLSHFSGNVINTEINAEWCSENA
jgi:hypothetical protein